MTIKEFNRLEKFIKNKLDEGVLDFYVYIITQENEFKSNKNSLFLKNIVKNSCVLDVPRNQIKKIYLWVYTSKDKTLQKQVSYF